MYMKFHMTLACSSLLNFDLKVVMGKHNVVEVVTGCRLSGKNYFFVKEFVKSLDNREQAGEAFSSALCQYNITTQSTQTNQVKGLESCTSLYACLGTSKGSCVNYVFCDQALSCVNLAHCGYLCLRVECMCSLRGI